MEEFIKQGRFYRDYHHHTTTLYTHLVGIPLTFLGIMIFLNFFHLIVPQVWDKTLAELGTIALLLYYLRLNWRLALLVTPFLILLLWISRLIGYNGPSSFALWSFIITLLFGLSLQFVTYFLEGSSIAFMHRLRRILVAPLFLVAELCFKAGVLKPLNEQLQKQDLSTPNEAPLNQDDLP